MGRIRYVGFFFLLQVLIWDMMLMRLLVGFCRRFVFGTLDMGWTRLLLSCNAFERDSSFFTSSQLSVSGLLVPLIFVHPLPSSDSSSSLAPAPHSILHRIRLESVLHTSSSVAFHVITLVLHCICLGINLTASDGSYPLSSLSTQVLLLTIFPVRGAPCSLVYVCNHPH